MELLRQMLNGGWSRLSTPEDAEDTEFRLRYTNTDIVNITKNISLRNVIRSQYLKYISHVCRCPNTTLTKKMLLAKSRRPYKRDPWRSTQDKSGFAALVDRVVASATP